MYWASEAIDLAEEFERELRRAFESRCEDEAKLHGRDTVSLNDVQKSVESVRAVGMFVPKETDA